ncbi:MAG: hypothetical protein VX772_07760 [Bacteroidota bacterium]|uniref:Uncharacterized protein n=1 Tax=Flagellimonas okinawensis TaxID=3031324 RepID=A0ABT5XMU8_9FLAO|nr:hypothetical protein [[Muricauda] okinawensis]MDF0707209.1 hypothetical protein [[Muricauda] okinawensis]MEC8832240.1 hypothetical protein [Bacteroidota bacterium]
MSLSLFLFFKYDINMYKAKANEIRLKNRTILYNIFTLLPNVSEHYEKKAAQKARPLTKSTNLVETTRKDY